MAMTDRIRIETDPRGIARLMLARPERHNALDAAAMDALTAAARRLGADPAVRVVILQAEGPTFCAGADLGWMQAQIAADAPARAAEARRLADMLGALDALPKPLIGKVQGNAFGGGIGMMAVCDCVVAAATARFALTETRLGLIPATIGPYVVARMGGGAARRVFFSGRPFDAAEAQALGLVARVVPPAALEEAALAEAEAYLATAPGAVADAKALVAALARPVTPEMIEHSIAALVARWEDAEAQAGIAAFFARRPASWNAG